MRPVTAATSSEACALGARFASLSSPRSGTRAVSRPDARAVEKGFHRPSRSGAREAPTLHLASRNALLLAALTLAATLPPLSASEGDEGPVGLNAVTNVATYVMTHPARFAETPTMIAARADLVTALEEIGLEVETHRYTANGGGTNIIGLIRGTERPNDWLAITSHYDSVAQVGGGGGTLETIFGAWDDGAGVAASLELARAATERSWKNTMAFVFFDDEELGLIGSRQFVLAYDGMMRDGAPIRIIGNINMDPPGLNWPCGVDAGASYPVVFAQYVTHAGPGQAVLRSYALAAKNEVGVPDWAFQLRSGPSVPAFLVLAGSSDHVRFGERGIPNLYVGSSVHLALGAAPGTDVPFMYPLHTPADSLATMLAYCAVLDQGFQVAMDIVWGTMERVDAHAGAFPRP